MLGGELLSVLHAQILVLKCRQDLSTFELEGSCPLCFGTTVTEPWWEPGSSNWFRPGAIAKILIG